MCVCVWVQSETFAVGICYSWLAGWLTACGVLESAFFLSIIFPFIPHLSVATFWWWWLCLRGKYRKLPPSAEVIVSGGQSRGGGLNMKLLCFITTIWCHNFMSWKIHIPIKWVDLLESYCVYFVVGWKILWLAIGQILCVVEVSLLQLWLLAIFVVNIFISFAYELWNFVSLGVENGADFY